ncbi:MAG: leucyl aminopeptidase [Solirubrobacteraceae bacterium]
MKVSTSATSPTAAAADMLAVAVSKPVEAAGAVAQLDEALGGEISRLVKAGEIRGGAGSVTVLHTEGRGIRAKRVAVVGLGKETRVTPEEARLAAGAAARAAQTARAATLAFAADSLPLGAAEAARCVVDGVVLGGYRFDRYRTRNRDDLPRELRTLTVLSSDRSAAGAARRATLVATAVNRARDLQNTPSNELGPEELADRAREIAAAHPTLRVEVLDEKRMAAKRMGAFLAVAQASGRPARLIVLKHTPARAARRRDVVMGMVGKGITFDSGGLSLKPARSMTGMKFDMSGAAAVLEATGAIAELGLPLRAVTVVGATENLPDSRAYRPDDVVTAANGKTIEVTNTDAEGRMVLADCLHHARTLGATHLIDLATLTGAVVVALGDYHAGLMGRDQEWLDRVLEAGERAGEHVWQLPLHETLRRFIRSEIADMTNSSSLGMAGTIYAARFLQEFAGEGPWAHVDIAGTADLGRSRGDYFSKGGTGFGVRLLVELAESLC